MNERDPYFRLVSQASPFECVCITSGPLNRERRWMLHGPYRVWQINILNTRIAGRNWAKIRWKLVWTLPSSVGDDEDSMARLGPPFPPNIDYVSSHLLTGSSMTGCWLPCRYLRWRTMSMKGAEVHVKICTGNAANIGRRGGTPFELVSLHQLPSIIANVGHNRPTYNQLKQLTYMQVSQLAQRG